LGALIALSGIKGGRIRFTYWPMYPQLLPPGLHNIIYICKNKRRCPDLLFLGFHISYLLIHSTIIYSNFCARFFSGEMGKISL